jgi:hypothetical protein
MDYSSSRIPDQPSLTLPRTALVEASTSGIVCSWVPDGPDGCERGEDYAEAGLRSEGEDWCCSEKIGYIGIEWRRRVPFPVVRCPVEGEV